MSLLVPYALSAPGPCELIGIVLILAIPVLLIISISRSKRQSSGFPILPIAQADGPGSYRIVGVDRKTRADRQMTIEAESRANAQVKAELDGINVTEVTKVS